MTSHVPVSLSALLATLPQGTRVIGQADRSISTLAIDSRSVQPGAMFVALRGEHTDGHAYVAQAVERGAVAVVMEEHLDVPESVTAIVVPDSARALSRIADAFYGHPSQAMTVVGVTGTNGKTTTTQMIAAMLSEAGMPCGTIGTIGARLGDREWDLSNTTPLALELHDLLAQMRDAGARAVAMEVSSHALALHRVNDVRFAAGGLTNITRDHLDFHHSFEAYAQAKRRLFDLVPRAVLNLDDPHGVRWAAEARLGTIATTYSLDHARATIHATDVHLTPTGSTFTVDGTPFRVALPGRFNVSNALCALAIARVLGVDDPTAARGLATLQRVSGRMENFEANGVNVIVDYAHTPDALENVLRTVRETTPGRVLAVFGCGGDRDRGKRPQMGAIAARLADYTFVTSDNPRTEEPGQIIAEIVRGVGSAPHRIVADRREAIEAAIEEAHPGDVVVVAGKGHEPYQIVGTAALPFDDREVAQRALAKRGAA